MVPIDHFDIAAELFADRTAIIDGEVELSFRDLQRLTYHVRDIVRSASRGAEPVPAGIYAPNDYRVVAAMLGTMRAGGVIVPMHAKSTVETNLRFLEQVNPRCLFYHGSLSREAQELQRALGTLTRLVDLEQELSWPSCQSQDGADGGDLDDWIDTSGNPTRPAFFWQTSGTSGPPKVVVNDCASFDATQKVMRAVLAGGDPSRRMMSLALAPLSHTAGPYAFTMLTLGATIVIARSFDAPEVLRTIERYGVTDVWMPPTALYLLLDSPDVSRCNLSSLRNVHLGAAAVAPEKLRAAVERLGPCVSQTYGQIESGPLTILDAATLAASVAGDRPERLMSSGRSIFVNRFAIMDEDGRRLPAGESGEIVVRGASVKPYGSSDQTVEARRSGWHHTGDLGYVDAAGFLYVVGRKKDVINTAGFKVPAAEVERIIMELPEVQECAVVAAPDSVRGEVIKAVVTVVSARSITSEQIIAHCVQRLGRGRAPASVEQWPELPKSAVGKIDKIQIRSRFWGAVSAVPSGHTGTRTQ